MKKLNIYEVQRKIMEIALKTGCGHVCSALSVSNILVDSFNASDGSEILILSKGHGVLALYVCLNLLGKLPNEALESFHKDGGLPEHPIYKKEWGLFSATGSLGHGLPIGIGYAIANPSTAVRVIMGDGELDEGSTMEALRFLQKHRITNILPVVEYNGLDAMGIANSDFYFQYKKYGTVKGKGINGIEDTVASHYFKITPANYEETVRGVIKAQREYQKNIRRIRYTTNLLNKQNEKNVS